VANLQEPQRKMLEKLHEDDVVLNGRRVLIVDDDIRNIFALTGVLARYNMHIHTAETQFNCCALRRIFTRC
jgi:response regulator RpfG family c-di-GMP phosphodiesterase